MGRIVCWFSCGAASAYATYLAKQKYGEITPVYCKVINEHPDNIRFLREFEQFAGIKVEVIGSEKHGYNVDEVFRDRGFIKNQYGACCTMVLKRWQREKYQLPDDTHIFGYTVDEQTRIDDFVDHYSDLKTDFILADKGIRKQDCYSFLTDAGIELPAMYMLGYNNNNCIGCVKGGMGYWNKIRVDFPLRFLEMAALEREIGHAINKDKNGAVYLDELGPKRGKFKTDQPASCGFVCEQKTLEFS